ncbi:MAG: hypothetical protein ACM3SS_16360 [Rhodospirillaceae bacterium]
MAVKIDTVIGASAKAVAAPGQRVHYNKVPLRTYAGLIFPVKASATRATAARDMKRTGKVGPSLRSFEQRRVWNSH